MMLMMADECLVIPFGRISPLRQDLAESGLLQEDGGSGKAQQFWEWSEEQVKNYL
jgi:hypothetical protein